MSSETETLELNLKLAQDPLNMVSTSFVLTENLKHYTASGLPNTRLILSALRVGKKELNL